MLSFNYRLKTYVYHSVYRKYSFCVITDGLCHLIIIFWGEYYSYCVSVVRFYFISVFSCRLVYVCFVLFCLHLNLLIISSYAFIALCYNCVHCVKTKHCVGSMKCLCFVFSFLLVCVFIKAMSLWKKCLEMKRKH